MKTKTRSTEQQRTIELQSLLAELERTRAETEHLRQETRLARVGLWLQIATAAGALLSAIAAVAQALS